MINNLTYAIINIDDLAKVDFSQIGETSSTSIRKSIDESEFVIKWNNEPSFITDGTVTVIGNTMNVSECLELMATPAWNEPLTEEVNMT